MSNLIIDKMYNTIYGRCKYKGISERTKPLRLDKKDRTVHTFEFDEAIWLVPQIELHKYTFLETEFPKTTMMSPDVYLEVAQHEMSKRELKQMKDEQKLRKDAVATFYKSTKNPNRRRPNPDTEKFCV